MFECKGSNILSTALILVGGYGTRLRPLVFPPSPLDLYTSEERSKCAYNATRTSASDHWIDPYTSKAIGRIREPAYDPPSGRGIGSRRCD